MLKKIRSNRDPKDTLYAEIRKEFRPWFDKAGIFFQAGISRFPRGIFGLMIVMLIISAVLTFTVFRHPEPAKKPAIKKTAQPLNDGFNQIMLAGAQLKQTIRLKKIVDSILLKKVLSAADSAALLNALDSLRHIHPLFK